MKFQAALFAATAVWAPAYAYPGHEKFLAWSPPGPNDVRGPCPMLNTLANHGFLPHSGYNITVQDTVRGLYEALNFNDTLSAFLFSQATTTNPVPNATTFSLKDLRTHDILEHDASLSRGDYYFGNDYSFNQTVFDETASYWTGPIIDLTMAVNARLARVHTSNATNPTFGFSPLGLSFSFGETAAYLNVFGTNTTSALAIREWVVYLFENEHLPTELGWSRPKEAITEDTLFDMLERVSNATDLDEDTKNKLKRGDLHTGRRSH